MKRFLQTLMLLLFFAYVGPAMGAGPETKQQYFDIFLPEGFKIQKVSPVEDFEMYTVTDGTVPYVEIYVGNAPDFPQIANFPDDSIVVLKTREMSLLSKWDGGEVVALETLIVRLIAPGWPRFVHAWTTAEAGDKRLAQKILLSLNVERELPPE